MAPSLENVCTPSVRKYAFWSLIALLTAMTVHDVYYLVDEYLENPKQVDMMVIFNETITFPNITICADMKQFSSFFKAANASVLETWDKDLEKALKKIKNKKQFLESDWEYHIAAESMLVIMTLTSIEVETATKVVPMNLHQLPRNPRLHGKNKMINDWMKRLNDWGVTYQEFYQKAGMQILTKGLHRMKRITHDDKKELGIRHKIMWISQLNFCFQPIFDKDVPITTQGQFLLFQAKYDMEKLSGHDINCMKADFHGRPSDYIRTLDGPGAGRDGVAGNLCFGQYVEVRVEVKTTFDMLPNDSPGRECEELGADGKNYYDCKLLCRVEYIRNLCNCTPISLAYLVEDKTELASFPICSYDKCTIDPKTIDLKEEPLCQKSCKRDCHQVSFLWGSFEYVGLEQDLKYSPVDFISALGGAIGVYLGLSVLTLVVGLVYGCDMIHRNLNDYWSDRKLASGDQSGEKADGGVESNGTTAEQKS